MTTIKSILTQPMYREEIVGSGLRSYFREGKHRAASCGRFTAFAHNAVHLDL